MQWWSSPSFAPLGLYASSPSPLTFSAPRPLQASEAAHQAALQEAERRCEELRAAVEQQEGRQQEALAALAALTSPADAAFPDFDSAVQSLQSQRQQWQLVAMEQEEAASRSGWAEAPGSGLGLG